MQTRKKLSILWAALLTASLIVGACTPATAPTPAPTAAPAKPVATTAPGAPAATAPAKPAGTAAPAPAGTAAAQPAAPSAPLARDQKITLPSIEPPTLDPGKATDTTSVDVVVQIFEGLLEFDDQGNPIPVVAEKWSVSPDGLTYTFNLRKGPTWTDGTPVTARDFEYAVKRNLDPKTASDYSHTLYPIKGAEEFNTGKATDPNTVGVTAKDDQTLVVALAEPAAYFLRLASTWTMFPLPKATIEKNGDKWIEPGNIVTNGPFMLKSWKHDAEMVLAANDKYWGKKPTLTEVTIKIFAQTDQTLAQMLAAYENNEIDVGRTLPPSDIDRIRKDTTLSKQMITYDFSAVYFLVVNSSKAPFDKPEVRRALALAIDPQKVVDIVRGAGTPATSTVPPGIPRNEKAYPKRPDVDAAKKELAAAGFPNGAGLREITYTYNTGGAHKPIGEYLQQAWGDIGVKVKLESMEWAVFLKWRQEANYDLYRGGWVSDYEDPYNWYNVLLDSKQSAGTFKPNWKNEQFDKTVRQAASEVDGKKREQLYMQADEILAKEMPFLPIYNNARQSLVKPKVDGWKPTRILDLVYLKNVRMLDRR